MTRTSAALRPQPTARRHFSGLVVCPAEGRRDSFSFLLERAGARHVVACNRGVEARQQAQLETNNDICILDGSTTDTPLLVLARQLQALGWRRIMLVSARHDALGVRAALLTGIRSYIVTGNTWGQPGIHNQRVRKLTEREVEVLQSVANGMSNKDIGAYLGLSALTVKSHMARISRKLGTGDRAKLVAIGMREGIIS